MKIRPSPTESATLYKVGTKKIGNDGNKWVIVENVKGVKRWKLLKKVSKNNSKKQIINKEQFFNLTKHDNKPLEKIIAKNINSSFIYNILTTKIFKEINKLGIETFIVPLPMSKDGLYFDDYAGTYIEEHYKKNISKINFLYFTFFMNNKGDAINLNRNISVNFNKMDKETKMKIIDIFEKYLFDYFEWSGSNAVIMNIHYQKIKNKSKLNKNSIKDDDIYPYIEIIFVFKNNKNKDIAEKLIKFGETFIGKDIIWQYDFYDFNLKIYSFTDYKKHLSKIKNFLEQFNKNGKSHIKLIEFKNNKEIETILL